MTKAQVMMNELMYIRRRMNACVCMEINEKQFFSISCLRFVGDGGCVGVDVSPNNKLKNYDRLINISNPRMLPPQTICLRWHEHKTTTLDMYMYEYKWQGHKCLIHLGKTPGKVIIMLAVLAGTFDSLSIPNTKLKFNWISVTGYIIHVAHEMWPF